ncbi:hypothetical protein NQ176_g391 [Zarea fungicola]|uniref:Uncharacterized protein n=1 Tax=Zarea fungicola TaxID=93591 RepID=A0ACC1NY18_9HYPO|nr:hypothetical protein NQ176_g391 [Lecanicillium fungicola]
MITNGVLGDGTIDPLLLRLEPQEYSISASEPDPTVQVGVHEPSLQQALEHNDDQDVYLAALEHDGAKGWKFPEYFMPWDGQQYRSPDGLYYCPEYACAKRIGDEFSRDLRRHVKGHFRPIACPACYYRSIEQKEMKRHFYEVHAQNLSEHVCPHPGCGRTYKRRSSVNRHVHEQHPGLGAPPSSSSASSSSATSSSELSGICCSGTVMSDDDDEEEEDGEAAGRSVKKQPRTLTWRKDRSASFKTVYACIDDEDGSVVGRLRSGGMFNWKKGGEIDVLDSLTESQRRLFLVAAGGIWALEALNYQSLERGFDKRDAPSENAK